MNLSCFQQKQNKKLSLSNENKQHHRIQLFRHFTHRPSALMEIALPSAPPVSQSCSLDRNSLSGANRQSPLSERRGHPFSALKLKWMLRPKPLMWKLMNKVKKLKGNYFCCCFYCRLSHNMMKVRMIMMISHLLTAISHQTCPSHRTWQTGRSQWPV